MSYLTHAEASKAKRVNEAFQQVLDTPGRRRGAPEPAMKPLLDLAAD